MFRKLLSALFILSCTTQAPEPQQPPPNPHAATPVQPKPIRVCINVAEDKVDDVEGGVFAWDYAIGQSWRPFRISERNCNLRIFDIDATDSFGNLTCKDVNAFGCVEKIGGLGDEGYVSRIYLIRGSYEAVARNVTMHEIGHTLGLDHMEGTLMQGLWPIEMQMAYIQCPDRITVSRVAQEYNLIGTKSCTWISAFTGKVEE